MNRKWRLCEKGWRVKHTQRDTKRRPGNTGQRINRFNCTETAGGMLCKQRTHEGGQEAGKHRGHELKRHKGLNSNLQKGQNITLKFLVRAGYNQPDTWRQPSHRTLLRYWQRQSVSTIHFTCTMSSLQKQSSLLLCRQNFPQQIFSFFSLTISNLNTSCTHFFNFQSSSGSMEFH